MRGDLGGTTRAGSMPRSVPFGDYLIESLDNSGLVEAYLSAALEEGDPCMFPLALRDVAQARGMKSAATRALQSLARALLDGFGFQLAVESKDAA